MGSVDSVAIAFEAVLFTVDAGIDTLPLSAVLPFVIMAVVAAAHPGTPLAVIQVPAQGLLDAAAEIVLRLPAQVLPDLRSVDGVAPVMAGTVLHEADQFTVISLDPAEARSGGRRSG